MTVVTTSATCPYLKRVAMLYCDACPVKKMVPEDHLTSLGPCATGNYFECGLYRDVIARLEVAADDDDGEAGPDRSR